MAGHSKWANIKHKKAAQDARRGKSFSVISKKISIATRRAGPDPDMNAELRLYLQKARALNMPADNIKRLILRASGQLPGVTMEAFTYEGYGPGGVAITLEGATDNKNRTIGNVRYIFSRNGGNLGANGCVAWMFHAKGLLSVAEDQISDPDALLELALERGAEDFEQEGGALTFTTAPEDYLRLREALEAAGVSDFLQDELTRVAETQATPSLDEARQCLKLIEALEEDDDIESVYHNLAISDELAAALEDE